jgi:flagellar export protein FliJ
MPSRSFRFRLERVRALREQREELARVELATAVGRLSSSERRLLAADARLAAAREEQRSASALSGLSGEELRTRQAFLERMERQRALGARAVARHEVEVRDRGRNLTRAAQEHRMLERLKEHRRAEHTRASAREEARELDEIAAKRVRRDAA